MKIWIYWSESNSRIYFYIFLKKKLKKIYWSEQSLIGLGSRIGAHREDCKYRSRSGQTDRLISLDPPSQTLYKYSTNHFNRWSLLY
jgi:hypothetical protein